MRLRSSINVDWLISVDNISKSKQIPTKILYNMYPTSLPNLSKPCPSNLISTSITKRITKTTYTIILFHDSMNAERMITITFDKVIKIITPLKAIELTTFLIYSFFLRNFLNLI